MPDLSEIETDELVEAIADVSDERGVERLVAALAHRQGVSQSDLATWFDVERKTIYNWLSRCTDDDPAAAATDAHRSGRDRKLDPDELATLRDQLRHAPRNQGFDRPCWTPALCRRHVRESFDVAYSIPSCRRLLREAGLTYESTADPGRERDDGAETDASDPGMRGCWTP